MVLTDERMTQLLLDLKAREAATDDHRGQAFSYATVIAAVANEWNVSVKVAREILGNWLAGKGEIDAAGKPPLMIVYADSWTALTARDRD